MDTATQPSRAVRWYVRGFLVLFLVCGLARLEWYPFSGFRLFSALRHERQTSWSVTAVDAAGREQAMPFGQMAPAYRHWFLVARDFARASERTRLAACEAWARGAREAGTDAREIRVHELTVDVGERAGRRGAQPERALIYSCR